MDRNVRYNTLHGVAQNLVINLYQPFLGIYAIKLGGSNTIVALLSSLPALASALAMIPGAFWLERQARRKLPTAAFYAASRLVLIPLALIPLWAPRDRAIILAVLVGLMNLPAAVATVSWQALCADVFPLADRARVFAVRNRWMSLAGLFPTIIAGVYLDRVRFPLGYQTIFAAAAALSVLEIWFLLRLREGETAKLTPAAPRRLDDIKGQRRFWRFTLVSLMFYFPWQMGWPLFTIYQVRYLGATNAWTAALAVIGTIATWLSSGWWARESERRGTLRMLVAATGGLALTPVLYALSNSLYPVVVFNLAIGVFSAGATLLLFNGLLEVTPREDCAAYIAYNNTLVNLSAFLAPFAGNLALELLGIKGALVAVAILRALGAAAIGIWLCGGEKDAAHRWRTNLRA